MEAYAMYTLRKEEQTEDSTMIVNLCSILSHALFTSFMELMFHIQNKLLYVFKHNNVVKHFTKIRLIAKVTR